MKTFKSISIKTAIFMLVSLGCFLISCSTKKDKIKSTTEIDMTKSTTEKNKPKSTLEEEGLKGKVKSLIETENNPEDTLGEIRKKYIQLRIITSFDEDGNILETANYDNLGKEYAKETFNYDANGRVIERRRYQNNNLFYTYTYKYDNKGHNIEMNTSSNIGLPAIKVIRKFDEKGNKIEEYGYNADSILFSKIMSKYDSSGHEIEINGYNSDGSLDDKSTFKYDEKGNRIENNHSSLEEKINEIISYKYDENNNLVEEIHKLNGKFTKNTYKYDKYDKYGNWLIKIERGNMEGNISPLSITEREIDYFED